jgi:EmrB/QacA subfamily drug resistance transporter
MLAVALGVFLSTLDGSIVNVALPVLARELGASFASVQWVVLTYLLTLVTLMMVAGRLGDLRGKKQLYLFGFVTFTLGSLSCGLSSSVGWLLGSRILQGAGASFVMALGPAILVDVFPPNERGRALGWIGLMVSVGLVSGPTVGGLLLGLLPWQAIFFVNLPFGVFGTILVSRVLEEGKRETAQTFDLLGALLLFAALLSFLLAVTFGPRTGLHSPLFLTLGGIAVVLGTAFVRRELRVRHPLVDLGLFRDSGLRLNVVTGVITFFSSSGLVFLVPFFLEDLQKRSPSEAGVLLVVSPLAMGLMSPVSGWLSDRIGSRPLTLVGLCFVIVGYLLLSTLELGTGGLGYVGRVMFLGLGMGIFQSPNNSAIMGAVPRDKVGVASGLLSLTRTCGQTTGIAVVGASFAGLVHHLADSPLLDARHASAAVQLRAFQWTARGLALLITSALALLLHHSWQGRRRARAVAEEG